MITSMTAFARKMEHTPFGQLTWEVRSVNHRYLEITTRLPEQLRAFEKNVREVLGQHVQRGKVDATLRFQPGDAVPFEISVNQALLKQLAGVSKVIETQFPTLTTSLTSLLAWPGVLQTQDTHMEEVAQAAIKLLEQTLTEFTSMRAREGEGLKTFFEARLAGITAQVAVVEKRLPLVHEALRSKIIARFEELALTPDSERLEQEMVYLLQKMDVAEELQRLVAHITEVRRTLKQKGAMGRRLDFLMQELNREANTLGSKSADSEMTQAMVEIKVQIEQMREQVQNIE